MSETPTDSKNLPNRYFKLIKAFSDKDKQSDIKNSSNSDSENNIHSNHDSNLPPDYNYIDEYGFCCDSYLTDYLTSCTQLFDLPRGAIIVGECGMGKTYLMECFSKTNSSHCKLFKIAKYIKDSPGFSEEISSLSSDIDIIIFDGVDEAPDLRDVLHRKIQSLKKQRRIFVSSREFSNFIDSFKDLELPVYKLMPFSRENAKDFVALKQVDGDVFLSAVFQAGFTPLAANPLGCKSLISSYSDDIHSFTDNTRDSLWVKYMSSLCLENDTSFCRDNGSKIISVETVFEIVSKIAMTFILMDQRTIKSFTSSSKNPFSVLFSDSELETVNHVLLRSISTCSGDNSFRFAHQSYLDYFAARGIKQFIHENYWDSIFVYHDNNTSLFIPKFEGVIAWLARLDTEWCKKVLDIQPELLLISDVVINQIGKAEICSRMLERANYVNDTFSNNLIFEEQLSKLNSSDIVPVLKNLYESEHSAEQEDLLITIIRKCRLYSLEDTLVEIFCSSEKDYYLRCEAGYALCDFASENARKKCKNILNDSSCDLDLKGILFKMTWPDFITFQEIGPHFSDKYSYYLGAFHIWVDYEFDKSIDLLTEEQSIEALSWISNNVKKSDSHWSGIVTLKQKIFSLCWNKYFKEEYLGILSKTYLAFMSFYLDPFDSKKNTKDDSNEFNKRCSLIEYIVSTENNLDDYFILLSLFDGFDVMSFIINKIMTESDYNVRNRWGILFSFNRSAIALPEQNELWNQIYNLIPEIILNAEEELQSRDDFKKQYDERETSYQRKIESFEDRKKIQLEQNILSFKRSLANATIKVDDIIIFLIQESNKNNVSSFSVMKKYFNVEECEKIVCSTIKYLNDSSLFDNINFNASLLCLHAFYIIMNSDKINSIPEDIWTKYSQHIMLDFDAIEDREEHERLLRIFSESASNVFSKAMFDKAMSKISSGCFLSAPYLSFLDTNIVSNILTFCRESKIIDNTLFTVLNSLKKDYPNAVKQYIDDIILKKENHVREFGNRISVLVLDFYPEKMKDINDLLKTDVYWGKQWLINIIGMDYYQHPLMPTFSNISLDYLADFYIWLHTFYPSRCEPQHKDCFTPSFLDEIYELISRIYNFVCDADDAVIFLQRIYQVFPEDTGMERLIRFAKRRFTDHKSKSFSINNIKKMIQEKENGILIQTPENLLDAFCDALKQYQVFLTGVNNPQIECLWNVDEKNHKYSHKREEDFSNHLKSFLEYYFIKNRVFINREVQLNAGRNGEPGARTDIWIDVSGDEPMDKICLCIEVKGSWNREAPAAMRDQLINKYMKDDGADAGILLVGWFDSKSCPLKENQWNNDRGCAKEDLKEQALMANRDGYLVKECVIECDYRK